MQNEYMPPNKQKNTEQDLFCSSQLVQEDLQHIR